jgi:hypothetical protein
VLTVLTVTGRYDGKPGNEPASPDRGAPFPSAPGLTPCRREPGMCAFCGETAEDGPIDPQVRRLSTNVRDPLTSYSGSRYFAASRTCVIAVLA